MSEVCKTCGTDLAVASAAIVSKLLRESAHWDTWGDRSVGYRNVVAGLGYVKVLGKHEDKSGYMSQYGEYEQGWTGTDWFVVQVESGPYAGLFKKVGTRDSYGEVVWDSDLKKVTAQEKTVVEYIFE